MKNVLKGTVITCIATSVLVAGTAFAGTDDNYTYLQNKHHLYVASFLSDSVVKIENWYRFDAVEGEFAFKKDVLTIKADGSEAEFAWVDDDHTAFKITMQDEDNTYWKESGEVYYSLDAEDPATVGFKEMPEGGVYTYNSDMWDMYVAQELSDSTIKIEGWYRFNASEGEFAYDHDVFVINTEDADFGFEWLDDDHTAFRISMLDDQNVHWKDTEEVVFIAE